MSTEKVKLILNIFLLAFQVCLGVWQFMKLTPVGALIQGVVGWLLRRFWFSPTYHRLQNCPGRVFKRAYCFTLQTDIPSERRGIVRNEVNTITLKYLGSNLLLEREGMDRNMLFVNKKMCYYITRTIWDELQTLEEVLSYGLAGPPSVRTDVARARAKHLQAAAAEATRAAASAAAADYTLAAAGASAASWAAHVTEVAKSAAAATAAASGNSVKAERAAAYAKDIHAELAATRKAARAADTEPARRAAAAAAAAGQNIHNVAYNARIAKDNFARAAAAADSAVTAAADGNLQIAAAAASSAADYANLSYTKTHRQTVAAVADAAAAALAAVAAATASNSVSQILFVQGNRQFWKGMITGGVMTLEEIVDAIILYNHHVSVRLNNDWLLPVNLSVSEERLLKILNLIALFLQTKKMEVHWLIPTFFSFISALLEFNTTVRVLLYTKINMLFCYIVHFICDPLPYAWRQQVYSLGKWVENLAPCNDIQVKVVRDNISAIITEGAKVDQEGAILVLWLSVPDEAEGTLNFGFIEKKFSCNPTDITYLKGKQVCEIDITCTYLTGKQVCEISAPTISEFYVKCKSEDDFSHIITFVNCIAENRCGSLISYGPNKKVRVRGFEESITSYVDNGLPSVYTLELANVVVA